MEAELIDSRYDGGFRSTIALEQSDPQMLTHIGENLFRIPVPEGRAHDLQRFLLDYTVPLVSEQGQYRFELPLASDLEPIWDFHLTGTLHPPVDVTSITSPSHESVEFFRDADGRVRFDLHRQHVRPESAFTLQYSLPADVGVMVRSFESLDPDNAGHRWQHLAVTIPPEQHAPQEPPPADVLILADTSGSMRSTDVLRTAVRTIIDNLREDDRFQLGCLDSSFRPLTNGWMSPDSESAIPALGDLDQQFPLGASHLHVTLPAALTRFEDADEQRRQIVIYLGDGADSDDSPVRQWPAAFTTNGVRFSAVQIGDDHGGQALMEQAVRQTGGRLFRAQQTGDLGELFAWTLSGFADALRIESVSIDGVDPLDIFYDPSWPPALPFFSPPP